MEFEEVKLARALLTFAKQLWSIEKSLSKLQTLIDESEKQAKKLELEIPRSREPKTAALEKDLSALEHTLAVLRERHYELYKKKLHALREIEVTVMKLKYTIYHKLYKR
ncbi:MAG: hypothetical protein QW063_02610 [Candidatus Nanoarchaeia archaeon]